MGTHPFRYSVSNMVYESSVVALVVVHVVGVVKLVWAHCLYSLEGHKSIFVSHLRVPRDWDV